MKPERFHLLSPLLLLLGIETATAQQLDYGRYEDLFGEPVTVSATGKPERISDTPVIMDLITAEDIRHSGARDIPTLLRRLAGVDVTHAAPGTAETAVRGYLQPLGSRVMVTLNGRQVYFDGFGTDFWATLPVELAEIRQIEVIKGSQSALYGFNAVDGVINIVTFDPIGDPVNSAQGRIGNHALRELSATVTQSLTDGAGIRITAASDHVHDSGIVRSTPDNLDFAKNPNRRSVSANGAVDFSDGSRLDAELSHTDVSLRWIALYPFFDTRIKTDAIKAAYTVDTAIGRVNGTAYYTTVDMPWVQSQTYGPFSTSDRTGVVQISDLFKIGPDDSFRIGGEGRRSEMGAAALTGEGTLSSDLVATSLMWEHSFSPAYSMVNAARYDYFQLGRTGPVPLRDPFSNSSFDRAIGGVSVNSAFVAKVSAADKLRIGFARGLDLPSLNSFGQIERYQAGYGRLVYYGSPYLDASAVYDYQAGWEHALPSLGASLNVNAFHQMTMKHVSSAYGLVNGALGLSSTMATGSVANGVEVGLQRRIRNGWSWGANYTLERLHEHFDWGYRNAQPAHKANANLGYEFGDWEANLFATYISATKGLVIVPGRPPRGWIADIGDYTILSPRLAWHARENVVIEAVAENLWPYQETAPQRMETSYFLSVKITY
ncbi:TonB-dependent receptor plug domain-containing protein [Telmatospirillum sp.]|uniref:TonB-dependent receptor plug domain-containing protein n=1 Tax=Telmatospirillum sp. TaxID=2079197 RepID=UPI002841664C|nr:TonB-dependent receptor plug domain-containing protein [Telmatospirillum sp.]MDR3441240.1 TonB-dependent receptor plug domain-containing protein [Telmatospirillum sp.]